MAETVSDVRLNWLALHRLLDACEIVASARNMTAFWPAVCNNSRWVVHARRMCVLATAPGDRCVQMARLERDVRLAPLPGTFAADDDVVGDAFLCTRSAWLVPEPPDRDRDPLRRWLLSDQPPWLFVLALPGAEPSPTVLVFAMDPLSPSERRSLNALGMLYAREVGTVCGFLQKHRRLMESEAALKAEVRERERAEERIRKQLQHLEAVNYELDHFAHMISHDLKAPVRAIRNLCEWIEEDGDGRLPPAIDDYVKTMRQKVRQLGNMIDGMLRYSRAVHEEPDALMEELDLADMVREIREMIPTPEGFRIEAAEPMPRLVADRSAVMRVLTNLVANAVKHHDRSTGRVTVSARDVDEWVEVSVEDDGPGIAPALHDRVFVLFQTLAGQDDENRGSGIGLAVVRKIVENQGGSVALESAPGEGATFRFTWPARPYA